MSGVICFQALSRLSLKLEGMIMSDAVERISLNGFTSFDVEAAACESECIAVEGGWFMFESTMCGI